jgi:hypothetical protein
LDDGGLELQWPLRQCHAEDDACSAGLYRVVIGPDVGPWIYGSSTGGTTQNRNQQTRLLPSCIDKY